MAREARQIKEQAWQQILYHVGLLGPNTHQAEDSPDLSVSKELEKASEKPDSSESLVVAKISMIPLSDLSKTSGEQR